MSDQPLLRLEGLTGRFGAVSAVQDLTAVICRGELVSFVDPSGCGRTTRLRLIGGFLRPDAGTVVPDGEDITALPPNQRATAMVFQSYAPFAHLTLAENVGYALAIRKRLKVPLLDEPLSNTRGGSCRSGRRRRSTSGPPPSSWRASWGRPTSSPRR